MKKKEEVGTRTDPVVQQQLDRNQRSLVDELITPHPKINERLGANCAIVSNIPAYDHDAQPIQGRGRVVWNRAYVFQAHGPSYLDPLPDPPNPY